MAFFSCKSSFQNLDKLINKMIQNYGYALQNSVNIFENLYQNRLILYICQSSTMTMILRQKANILQLLLLLLVLGSCKNNTDTTVGAIAEVPQDTMPHLTPEVKKQAKLEATGET